MAIEQLHFLDGRAEAALKDLRGPLGPLKQIQEITRTLQNVYKAYPELAVPNGWDYVAYRQPEDTLDPEIRSDLIRAGTGITQAEFHQGMLEVGLRKHYLMNFLQTKEIENNLSPEEIFNRLTSENINMVAIQETYPLSLAGDSKQLVVLFGLHFLDTSFKVLVDKMEGDADSLGSEKWIPLDSRRIEDMQLYLSEPRPMNVLAQTKLINRLFPNGKRFELSNQAREIMTISPDSEVIIPEHAADHHFKNSIPVSAIDVGWSLGRKFAEAGWQVS